MTTHLSSGAWRVLARDAPCSVHSVFDHVVNVRVGEELLLLGPKDRAEVRDCPFGAALEIGQWQQLQHGLADGSLPSRWDWSRPRGSFRAAGTTVLQLDPRSWEVAPPEPLPTLIGTALLALPADAPEPGLLQFYDASVAQEAVRRASAALAGDGPFSDVRWLIGRGPGLTPSGDDVLVGLMAGLGATGRLSARTALVLEDLLRRRGHGLTTDVSLAYLRCALRGELAGQVLAVVRALADGQPVGPAVQRLLGHGHTSGSDLLWGLAVGLGPAGPGASS